MLFFEAALRKILVYILRNDAALKETLEALEKNSWCAHYWPPSTLKSVRDVVRSIGRAVQPGEQDSSSDVACAADEIPTLLNSIEAKVEEHVRDIKTANTKFSFYADDSWVDMKVRELYIEADQSDNREIHELLAALLEDYKRYQPLWKTEEEFWNLLDEYARSPGNTTRPADLMERARRLQNAQELLSEKFNGKLKARRDLQANTRDIRYPFLVEFPALSPHPRLSIGISAGPPDNAATLEGALYDHFKPILDVTFESLRLHQKLVPLAYAFVHRSFAITPVNVMEDLVATLDELSKKPTESA